MPPEAQQQSHQNATTSNGNSGNGNSTTSNTSRRATILFNKVKQPLRDLGSNFNTSITTGTTNTTTTATTTQLGPSQSSANLGITTVKRKSSTRSSNRDGRQLQPATSASSSKIHSQNQQKSSIPMDRLTSHKSPSSSSHSKSQHQKVQHKTLGTVKTQGNLNSSIDITSLSYIPGAKEYYYLGNLSFSFVRETNSVRENGGLNGFIHCFLMEVYAIVRAHVSALGGNAFLSFRLQQSCIFYHSNKNQAQCLISVAGDAAHVTF